MHVRKRVCTNSGEDDWAIKYNCDNCKFHNKSWICMSDLASFADT